jgi:hypothetical protein
MQEENDRRVAITPANEDPLRIAAQRHLLQ